MKESIVLIKSESFAIKIMNLYEELKKKKVPYPIIEQIIKSGTSIGANLSEAICGISKKDFLAKIYISLKECNETKYWLRILHNSETGYLSEELYNSLYKEADEIYRILLSITKTISTQLKNS